MRTNNKRYNAARERGDLAEALKDGTPKGAMRIVAYLYPIIMGALLLVTVGLYRHLRKRISMKAFIATVITGYVAGITMNIFFQQYDPNYPAWMYHAFSLEGPEWLGVHIYDWIFYGLIGAMLYLLRALIPNGPDLKRRGRLFVLIMIGAANMVAMLCLGPAGLYFALWYGVPAMFLLAIVNKWNAFRFVTFSIVVVVIACAWDVIAVDWVRSFDGMEWAQQWMYRCRGVEGEYHHSTIWRPERWAWIGNKPLAEWPWFSTAGGWCYYAYCELYDTLFAPKGAEHA